MYPHRTKKKRAQRYANLRAHTCGTAGPQKKDPLITESYWLIHFLTDWKSCFSLRQQLWWTHLRKRSRAHLIPGLLRVNLCDLCCVRLHFGLQFFDLSSLLHRPVCHLSVKMASYEIEKIESVLLHWQWNSSPAAFHSVSSRVHALTFWQLVLHRQEKETGKRDRKRDTERDRVWLWAWCDGVMQWLWLFVVSTSDV